MPNNNVEERIVEMQIDNKKFESGATKTINLLEKLEKALNIKGNADAFDSINAAVERFNPNPIINGLNKIIDAGGVAGTAVKRLVENMTDGLYNGATGLLKDMTIGQVKSGFDKYEQLAQSTQMIMASTRDQVGEGLRWSDEAEQMADVNAQLEKLLWYTDETSYSFSDGADNIGKFLSAGVDYADAFSAIMGVMTLGGSSGAKVQEVSNALYNISQAMGTGSMKTIDWKSIENANLATLEFKQNVIETAAEMGVLTKIMYENDTSTEGFLPSIDKDRLDDAGYIQNLTEKEIDSIINAKNFRESLSSGWFTDEVMTEVFKKYGAFSDALYEAHQETKMEASDLLDALDAYRDGLDLQEYADDAGIQLDTLEAVVKRLDEVGIEYSETGFRLGQEAKTWSDALDATRDAVSSRWMQTFKLIFGDYLQAKKFWTDITGELFDIFAAGGDVRNKVLEAWNQADENGFSGRDFILGKKTIKNIDGTSEEIQGAFWDILDAIHSFVDPIKDAFAEVFGLRPGDVESTGHALRDLSKQIKEFTKNLGFSKEAQQGIKNLFSVLFTLIKMMADVLGAVIPIIAHVGAAIGEIIDAFIRLTAGQVDISGFCKAVSASFKSILPSADDLKDGLKGLGKFFLDMLPNEEQIVGFFNNLGEVIQNAWESVKQFFKTNTLSDLLPTTEQIGEFLDKVADFLDEKFPSLANWVRTIKESNFISDMLTKFTTKVQEFSAGFTNFFKNFKIDTEKFKSNFETFSNLATNIITVLFGDPKELKAKIDTFIHTLWQSISDAASKLTFADIIKAFKLAGFTSFVASITGAISQFKKIEKEITGIPESINEIFGNIASGVKDISKSISANFKSNAFLKIAASIAVIAIALYALSTIDENKLMLAAAVVLLIMLVLKKIVDAMNAKDLIDLNKNFQQEGKSLVSIRDSTFKVMNDFASILIGLGVLVAAIGYSISAIAKAGEKGDVVKAAVIVGVMLIGILGAVVGLSFIFRKFTQGKDSLITKKQSEQLGIMLAAAGAAMFLIGNAIKKIAQAVALLAGVQSMGGDIVTAALVLGIFAAAMLGIFVGLVAVVNAVASTKTDPNYIKTYGQTLIRLAVAFVIIVAAIGALIYPIMALAAVIKIMGNANALWMAAGLLGAIMLALAAVVGGLMVGLHFLGKNGTDFDALGAILLKIAFTMIIISVALLILSGPIIEIATLASLGGKVWQALGIVALMTALMGALAWVLISTISDLDPAKIDSIGKAMLKIGVMMLLIAVAMKIIMGAVMTLSIALLSPEILQSVVYSALILGLLMAALMLAAATAAKIDSKNGILKVAAAMLIMAIALWIFVPAIIAFIGVAALLTTTIKDMEKFGETVGKLALLSVALILFAVGCTILGVAVLALGVGMFFLATGLLIAVVAIEGLTRAIPPFVEMLIAVSTKFDEINWGKVMVAAFIIFVITAAIIGLVIALAKLFNELKQNRSQGDYANSMSNVQRGLSKGLTALAASLKTKVVEIFAAIGKTLVENFPTIMSIIGGLLVVVGLYLVGFIPTAVNLIGRAIVTLFESLYQVMSENKGVLEHAIFGIVATVLEIATDAIDWAVGILLPYIGKGLMDGVASLLKSVGLNGAADWLTDKANEWFDPERLRENFKAQSANNHDWFTGIIPEAEEWHDFVADETAPALLSGLSEAKDAALGQVKDDAGALADSLQSSEILEKYTGAGENIGSTTVNAADAEFAEGMPLSGDNAVAGLYNSITSEDNAGLLGDAGSWMAKMVEGGFNGYAEINSPSRLFARLGAFIPAGLGVGIEDNAGAAVDSIVTVSDLMYAAVESVMAKVGVIADDDFAISPRITPVVDMSNVDSASGYMNGAFGQNYSVSAQMSSSLNRRMADVERAASDMNSRGDQIYNGDVVTVNVYPAQGQSPEEIADAVITKISNRTMRRGVAFG